ncbi:sugar ABC transporter substrate-binding protein [Eubacteriales bacterium OttesenSCG-928-A19]|nr:sugar ABC transporter substrate-binding protein [Eubacteriales bacterium OttesenSCG-928-A19]
MKKWIALVLAMLMTLGMGTFAVAEDQEITRELYEGTSGTTVKLAFNGVEFDQDALGIVLREFVEETGHSVEIMYVPTTGGWGGYFNKLQTMIASGDIPDLIRIAIEGFQIFQSRDLIEPFNPYFEQFPEQQAVLDGLHPRILEPFKVGEDLYGLTFDWNNVVTHVNTNILEEAGLEMPPADWDYDAFLEYAKAMTYTREDGTKVYGTCIPDYYFAMSGWLFNNGASILNEDMTAAAINSPEAVEVFQFFQDLIYVHEVAPRPPFEAEQMFMNDQIGMYYAGRWPLRSYKDSGFSAMDVQYLPTNTGEQNTIFGSGIFPILKASQNKEAAFLLACKLSSAESQNTILQIGAIPANTEIMDKMVEINDFPVNTKIFRDSADVATVVESPATYADIQAAFDRALAIILANEATAQDALDACAREIDDIIAYN